MIGKKKRITQYVLNHIDANIDGVEDKPKDLDAMIKPVTITIRTNPMTRMLFVEIDGDIKDGICLLGKPLADNRILGRDGITDMSKDWNIYGEEWQVRDTEQYPDSCIYYVSDGGQSKKTHHLRRRLLEDREDNTGMVTREAAKDACADFDGVNKGNCVHDVMVTGDLEVAEDHSYGI